MFTSRNPYQLVIQRARRLVQELERRFQSGEINSRAGLLVHLVEHLGKFVGSLRTPRMEVPYLTKDDLLIQEKLEDPLNEAAEDIALAWDQVNHLREMNLQIFNVCQAERSGLNQQLAEVTQLLDSVRLWITDSDPTFIWVGDTFNTKDQIDEAASSVFVDTLGGVVTLPALETRPINGHITASRIDKEISAGGIPGNNLEIKSLGKQAFTGESNEPRPTMWGEVNPSDSLPNLWDDEPDTWFEWEEYRVPVPQPMIQAGNSYVYDPHGQPFAGISLWDNWTCYLRWPGEEEVDRGPNGAGYPLARFQTSLQPTPKKKRAKNKKDALPTVNDQAGPEILRLGVLLVLDEPRPMSMLRITPLIRNNCFPKVEQILISNDGERWRKLLAEPTTLHPRMNRGLDLSEYGLTSSNFEGVGVWPLPATPLRYISLVFSQEQFYECPLGAGHRYAFYGGKGKRNRGARRTPGYTPIVGSSDDSPASNNPEDDGPDIGARLRREETLAPTTGLLDKITGLFKKKRKKQKKLKQIDLELFDVVKAERRAISLRDITIEERVYAEAGVLASKAHQLTRAVKAVSLITAERIPDGWEETTEDGESWLHYEVSGDGETWHNLVPQLTELEDSVVHFEEPTKTLYFRATLRRPPEQVNEAPVLLAYGLKALPA